jgi:hypothetical protein
LSEISERAEGIFAGQKTNSLLPTGIHDMRSQWKCKAEQLVTMEGSGGWAVPDWVICGLLQGKSRAQKMAGASSFSRDELNLTCSLSCSIAQ